MLGDYRFNDRLSDLSREAFHKRLQALESLLKQVEAIAPSELPASEQLNQRFLQAALEMDVAKMRSFGCWEVRLSFPPAT